MQDAEAARKIGAVVAVQPRVPVETRDHDEHGQDEHNDSLGCQVRELLPHTAAPHVWIPPAEINSCQRRTPLVHPERLMSDTAVSCVHVLYRLNLLCYLQLI